MNRFFTTYNKQMVFAFLLSFCFMIKAEAKMPAINIESYSSTSLPEALDDLAVTYDVNIIYDIEQVQNAKISNWESSGTSAEKDLNLLLRGLSLTYKKLNERTFVVKKKNTNQVKKKAAPPTIISQTPLPILETIKVRGIVKDAEYLEPLIGVNVTVKGGTTGAITDFDGKFEIEVEKGSTLLLTYVGYTNREILADRADLGEIILEENASKLEEVVVVGYGTQKRSDLTGSLSSVSAKELKEIPATGLDQALQGRAAGVFVTQNSGAPSGGVSIRIRGIASTFSAEPLYVIDGIPVANDNAGTSSNFSELDGGGQNTSALSTINPNDIESIEILKDASATAIYGARGSNGVVLITTKRGKKGRSNVSLETYFGVQQLAKKIPVMNLQQYASYYEDVGWEQIEEFERPEILGQGTDWQDAVFRDAYMQNYQLTTSGGSDQTTFALSAGYHRKEGIVVGSNFTRFSGKVNIDHKIGKRARIGNSFLLSRTNERIVFNSNSNGVIYTALLMVPNAPVKNADGSFAGPQEEITLSFDNPVARALETDDVNTKSRILSNIYFEYDILPSLKYRTEFGNDILYSNHNTFYPFYERGNAFGKSRVNRSLNNTFFWINKHLLTYNKTIAEKHNITFLAGFEAQEFKYEFAFLSRENLPSNTLQQINLGNPGQQATGGGAGHGTLASVFGRLNYGYDDRYLLTLTNRRDGSSRFGPTNKWGNFPSMAFAWRISNEAFLKDKAFMDNFKLRLGYGAVGNQEIPLYSYASRVGLYNVVMGDNLTTGLGAVNIANPGVKWESSIQTNVGFDLGLFKNRIEFIVDYYIRKAEDMLLPAQLPSTAGSLEPPFVNIGKIENKGIELTLNTVNLNRKLNWRSSLNFTQNTNEVLSLGTNGSLVGIIQRLPVTRTEVGQPISQFYGHVTDGIFQTQDEVTNHAFQSTGTRAGDIRFKDLNNDGIITDADRTFLGSPHPDFTINLTNNFEYKSFDLSFFFQGVFGNEILNLVRRDIEGMAGLSNQSLVVADRFTNLKPSSTIPRADGVDPNANRRISDRFVESGTFVRLKNLTLGYNLPTPYAKRMNMQNMRLYISTQNLLTFTEYSGYDPEIGSFNQNPIINGVENGRYPIARSFTVGLNATF